MWVLKLSSPCLCARQMPWVVRSLVSMRSASDAALGCNVLCSRSICARIKTPGPQLHIVAC